MVSRPDLVLASIPVPALAGVVAGRVTEVSLLTALGLLGALLIIYREVFVVGVPE